MPAQLTGPALDRAACEAVGIEPCEWVAKAPNGKLMWKGAKDAVEAYIRLLSAAGGVECFIESVYPRVSTWQSVGLLVERLERLKVIWIQDSPNYEMSDQYSASLRGENGWASGQGSTPTEALCRAVVAWKGASK